VALFLVSALTQLKHSETLSKLSESPSDFAETIGAILAPAIVKSN
jgi:hypothetical protein